MNLVPAQPRAQRKWPDEKCVPSQVNLLTGSIVIDGCLGLVKRHTFDSFGQHVRSNTHRAVGLCADQLNGVSFSSR